MNLKIVFNPFTGKFDYINTGSSSSGNIPVYTADPLSPAVGDVWLIDSPGTPGTPMGLLLALTQTTPVCYLRIQSQNCGTLTFNPS